MSSVAIFQNLCYTVRDTSVSGAVHTWSAVGPLFGGSFFCPQSTGEGVLLMVTYQDLFMFCDLIVSIISLVVLIIKKK